MFYAYVLQSEINNTLYKGSTENVEKRIIQHNEGLVSYTSKFRPWKLVYFEAFTTRAEAMAREKFFKTGNGCDFIKNILKK